MFAVLGETITERAGVVNLSMNGTILLSAMGSFAVAVVTGHVWFGFLAGALIGALVALVVAFSSITLRQSQVAVGFVLALLCRDLSYFFGDAFISKAGPRLNVVPVPLLSQIPYLGTLLFNQDLMTYVSIILIGVVWFWMFRTRPGLMLRGIGERPAAAYVRGANVRPECEGRLGGTALRSGRIWLDRAGDHDFRRMESAARRIRDLPVCFSTMAESGTSSLTAEYSHPGPASGSFPADDPDAFTRQYWGCRMGSGLAGSQAGSFTWIGSEPLACIACFAARLVGHTV